MENLQFYLKISNPDKMVGKPLPSGWILEHIHDTNHHYEFWFSKLDAKNTPTKIQLHRNGRLNMFRDDVEYRTECRGHCGTMGRKFMKDMNNTMDHFELLIKNID